MVAIYMPVTLLGPFFVNVYWGLLYFTMGITVDNNWIPFNLMPEYGVPLTALLRLMLKGFFITFVVTYITGFIFRKSIQQVYWGIVCILFVLSAFLHSLYYPGNSIGFGSLIVLLLAAIFQWVAYKYILCEGGVFDDYFVKD